MTEVSVQLTLFVMGSVSRGGATQVPGISHSSTRYCLSCQGKRDLQPPVLAADAVIWRWPVDQGLLFSGLVSPSRGD